MLMAASALSVPVLDERALLGLGGLAASRQRRKREPPEEVFFAPLLIAIRPRRYSASANLKGLYSLLFSTLKELAKLLRQAHKKAGAAFGSCAGFLNKEMRKRKLLGAAGGDRTHDPRLRRPILYPLSYSRKGADYPRFRSWPGSAVAGSFRLDWGV